MNVFDFINSRDIAKHLKEINYKFSTLESAWLVWQSRKHTLKQKHAAWLEIIDTMPDCTVEARPKHEEVRSLHDYLKEYMDFQNQSIRRFFEIEQNAFYNGCVYARNGEGWDPSAHLSVDDSLQYLKSTYGDLKIHTYVVEKKFVGGDFSNESTLTFTESHDVLDVSSPEWNDLFMALWFDFPTPFEKGDIWEITQSGYHQLNKGYFDHLMNRFVVTSFQDKPKSEMLRSGCLEDMVFCGYYAGGSKLVSGCTGSYMDLELVRTNPEDYDQLLLPLSLHLKNKMDDVEML